MNLLPLDVQSFGYHARQILAVDFEYHWQPS